MRKRLPNRRRSESRKVTWQSPINQSAAEQTIYISIGYLADGLTASEIFYDSGYRTGSDLETLASDVCICLSIFLQHDGVCMESFSKSLAREVNLRTGKEDAASLVGVFIAELLKPPAWAAQVLAAQAPENET
jgi:hypothetical protein